MECLNKYCEWSGQQINLEKSGLFASKGFHAQFLEKIRRQKGLKKLPHNTKYLRVTLFLSSHRKKDFNYSKENLELRICSWKSKSPSWMGRATLINSFALDILSYSMSSFWIRSGPSGLCDEIGALIRKFWWNPSKESSHVHSPLNWETLCQPKKNGRLGFKYFADFNLALLSKMAWWILEKEDSPCASLESQIQSR